MPFNVNNCIEEQAKINENTLVAFESADNLEELQILEDNEMRTICAIDNLKDVNVDSQLNSAEVIALKSVVEQSYFNNNNINNLTIDYCMHINLIIDVPVYCGQRRLSYREKNEVGSKLAELLEKGKNRPSFSPYASLIVSVRKKDGSLRMCVDYRALNKITLKDNYPMPLIEDCLDFLGYKCYFTILDLESSFHQIPMHETSSKYTAFVMHETFIKYTARTI